MTVFEALKKITASGTSVEVYGNSFIQFRLCRGAWSAQLESSPMLETESAVARQLIELNEFMIFKDKQLPAKAEI